jgi:peptidoglycan hydrolase-like protein with peptidoglycan-binding domain
MPSSKVLLLQHELATLGYFRGPFTGFYGPITTAAVKRFQHSVGLHADGIWGPRSARALKRRTGVSL